MSLEARRARWVWGRLPDDLMALGAQAARQACQRAEERHLDPRGWTFDHSIPLIDVNTRGLQSELAFRVFTRHPIPTVAQLLAGWSRPDVTDWQVKHTLRLEHPWWGMFLTERHLAAVGVRAYVLLLAGEAPRFAIVGTITPARVRQVARPSYTEGQVLVPWVALEPYDGPVDRSYLE